MRHEVLDVMAEHRQIRLFNFLGRALQIMEVVEN